MTDQERESFFKRKHDEIVKQLLGDKTFPVKGEAEHVVVDKNWVKGRSFYDQPRIHKDQKPVNDGIQDWNDQLRRNNGRIIRRIEPEQSGEKNAENAQS